MSSSPEGKRFGQIITIEPDSVEEYIRIHNPIPQPIADCISRCHIYDYSIYHDPATKILFATFKYSGSDFDADMARMRADEQTRAWWKITDALQQSMNPVSTGSPDPEQSWWKPCREVFRQD